MPAGASSNVNDTGSSSAETSLAVVEPHVVEGPVPYDVEVHGGVGIRLFYFVFMGSLKSDCLSCCHVFMS